MNEMSSKSGYEFMYKGVSVYMPICSEILNTVQKLGYTPTSYRSSFGKN